MSKFKFATLLLIVFSILAAHQASAIGLSEKEKECATSRGLIPLQIPIIGLCVDSASVCCSEDGSATVAVKGAPDYISVFFRFGIIFISIVLVAVLVVAGLMYVSSGGNPAIASKALGFVKNAAYSLVVLIFSVVILNQIDPRLTSLKISAINPIKKVVCCEATGTSGDAAYWATQKDSDENFICNVTGSLQDKIVGDDKCMSNSDAIDKGQCGPASSTTGSRPLSYPGHDELFKKYGGCLPTGWTTLKAMAFTESGLQEDIVNCIGFTGLFQTKVANCKDVLNRYQMSNTCVDMKDPETSTRAGAAFSMMAVNAIKARCSNIPAEDFVYFMYVGHHGGPGTLNYVLSKSCKSSDSILNVLNFWSDLKEKAKPGTWQSKVNPQGIAAESNKGAMRFVDFVKQLNNGSIPALTQSTAGCPLLTK